nr:MAG TPA: Putative tail fiber protein fold, Tail fiber, receptor [Caudoviricetes sp.]
MGILKGILHHWNKTSSAYDTIHPETEVAQVTDWNKGIVNTLASTGLSSLVNVLSSDSLIALLIKKVFDATGVKYSLGQNGYVCWGALFGGVITQWGAYVSAANQHAYPIAFSEACYTIVTADTGDSAVGFGVKIVSKTEYYIYGKEGTNCHILMVGK